MKRQIWITMIITMVLLCGCSKSSDTISQNTSQPQATDARQKVDGDVEKMEKEAVYEEQEIPNMDLEWNGYQYTEMTARNTMGPNGTLVGIYPIAKKKYGKSKYVKAEWRDGKWHKVETTWGGIEEGIW